MGRKLGALLPLLGEGEVGSPSNTMSLGSLGGILIYPAVWAKLT